ncbi:MAG: hypothetical protein AB4368_20495 [Xenococcaceae cyanobacterium]
MDSKLLTALGCSGSIALSLLSTTPARANSSVEYVFTADAVEEEFVSIPARDTDYPLLDCSCSEYSPEMSEQFDREANKAIELFGCDCAGCLRLVRNLEETNPIN